MDEYGALMSDSGMKERIEKFAESFSRGMDGVISSMLAEMRAVTSSEGASIYVVDETSLHFAYIQTDDVYEDNPMHNLSIDMNSDSLCAYVARTLQPIAVSDARRAPDGMPYRLNNEFDLVTGSDTISSITAPIVDYSGGLAGIIQLVNHRDEDGGVSSYEDWMLGYVLLIIENFLPMISGAFERYRSIFHVRRVTNARPRPETAVEAAFNSLRSQIALPVSTARLPWLEGVRVSWSRRDMAREATVAKRITACSNYLNQFEDVNTIIGIILADARDAIRAAGGIFYIVDGAAADELRIVCVQNDGEFLRDEPLTRYVNRSVKIDASSAAGRAAMTRSVVNISDCAAERVCDAPDTLRFLEEVAGPPLSALCVPVLDYRGGLFAVCQLLNAIDVFGNPRIFDGADVSYCDNLTRRTIPYMTRAIMTRRLIDAMLRMSYMRDPVETGAHVRRVGAFAAEIYRRWAEKRKLSPEEIREEEDALRVAAMLHDIGKVAVPDAVLMKPARLTEDEYAIIKTHCALGASMYQLAHSRLELMAYDITLHHHQRWDGKGYTGDPDVPALKGEEIPLCARITAVADVLDALLFPRVYKASWDFESAISELVKNSGTQFDPSVVRAAIEISDTLRAIAERYGD
jgi:HD-GYP domain-containing protein (c-di-GMP phosphodiesterase class II)